MRFNKDLSLIGWEEVEKRQQHRLPLVEEWMSIVQMKLGNSVLDIGPGPGVFTLKYANRVGNDGKIVALEKSKEAAEHLRRIKKRNIHIILGDAEETKLDTIGSFDIIMLTDILHHTEEPAKVLTNIYKSKKQADARLLIAEFDPYSKGEIGPPISDRLSEKVLINLLKNTGFTVITSGKQLFEHYYILAQQ